MNTPSHESDPSSVPTHAQQVNHAPSQVAGRDAAELLRELQQNQDKLIRQNETLRESLRAMEASRNRYADLHEFAPVACLTLSHDGVIREINLEGAALLGRERTQLLGMQFANHVNVTDRDRWWKIFNTDAWFGGLQRSELQLLRGDGSYFFALIGGIRRFDERGAQMVHLSFTDITRLKEADECWCSVFESASDGIVITHSVTGEIIDLNQALANMVGRNKAELIGHPLNILCPPGTGDPRCNRVLQHQPDNHGAEIETQLLAKDGQIHEVAIKLSVMRMNGRSVEFGIVRDMTERRHAQAREERLRHILDSTLDMIFIFKPDTLKFVYLNKGAIKGLGYSLEEMQHMSPMDVVPLIPEPECRAFIAPLVSGIKEIRRFEAMLKRRDGKKIPVEAQLQYVRDGDSGGLFVVIARDIARRKIAENELRYQKNLMWQVIDLDRNMIFVRDDKGKFLLANQATADFLDVPIQSLIGKTIAEPGTAAQHALAFFTSDDEVIRAGQELAVTEAVSMPDSQQHWYLTVKRPMRQADGSVHVLGIAADISALKQSEIKLEASYRELQRLALHLENVRSEERVQIARNLHDELGAILAAMKMRIAWIASKLPGEMPQIADEVNHLAELVSQGIRTVRQVVSDLRPNLLDDVGLIAAVKDYIRRFQRDTAIECNLVLPEQGFMLDENQSTTVFRIIQESLSNVARHAHASKVAVMFGLDDQTLQVQITDNGIGFESTRKGWSYGLIGIKERALMIGADSAIESSPGQGTRVTLRVQCERTRGQTVPDQ